jgi:hypothetical protein
MAILAYGATTPASTDADPHFDRAAKCVGLLAPSSRRLRRGDSRDRRDGSANERLSAIRNYRWRKRRRRSDAEAMRSAQFAPLTASRRVTNLGMGAPIEAIAAILIPSIAMSRRISDTP